MGRSKDWERLTIEKLVRQKNTTYHTWRCEHDYSKLTDWCAEALMVHGGLPRWDEGVRARRSGRWHTADLIQQEQKAWRGSVRMWCLQRGITRFPNQSAQFLKFYFAWYRYEWERINGAITRTYGRQMM